MDGCLQALDLNQITSLLGRISQGDDAALAQLTPLVYAELKEFGCARHAAGT